MGRPKLPDEERRTEVLQIRLTKLEREVLEEGAAASGLLLTELIRESALRFARMAITTPSSTQSSPNSPATADDSPLTTPRP